MKVLKLTLYEGLRLVLESGERFKKAIIVPLVHEILPFRVSLYMRYKFFI